MKLNNDSSDTCMLGNNIYLHMVSYDRLLIEFCMQTLSHTRVKYVLFVYDIVNNISIGTVTLKINQF